VILIKKLNTFNGGGRRRRSSEDHPTTEWVDGFKIIKSQRDKGKN